MKSEHDNAAPPAPAAKPAVHDEHVDPNHNMFGDWVPPAVGNSVSSLMHLIDDDLQHTHAPAPAAAPAPGTAPGDKRGADYATKLAALTGATSDPTAHYKILNLLDSVDDPAVRADMKQQFQQQTGKSVEEFILNSDWAGKRDKFEALSLVSHERDVADANIAKMSPEERAKLTKQGFEAAKEINSVAGKSDANDAANANKISDALAGKTPEQVEAIRAAVRTSTNGSQGVYELIDRSLSKGHEDEAISGLSGQAVHSASVALINAKDDPKRARELLGRLDDAQIAELRQSPKFVETVTATMPESERHEIELRLAGNKAGADANRITSLLADPKDNFVAEINQKPKDEFDVAANLKARQHAQDLYDQRSPQNILHELEKMSPQQMKSARDAYNPKEHDGKTWDEMLGDRFDKKDVQGQRIAALLRGDKIGDKALELREGMRTHNQEAIEEALGNEDLASKNPERHAHGLAEQQALAARVQQLDEPAKPSWMPALPNASHGRTLDQQLDDSYKNYVDAKAIDPDSPFANTANPMAMLHRDKREDEAKDQRTATNELISGGKLSRATEMYRARKDDGQRADILDEVGSKTELGETEKEYQAKYGKAMIAGPDLDKYAYEAHGRQLQEMMHGKGFRPIEEVEKDLAAEHRDVNEQRVEQTRTEGVKSERTADQLAGDQHQIYDKQYSDRLEKVENMREYWGGAVGSQHLYREGVGAMDAHAATGDTETVRQIDTVATEEQKTAREEKVKLAESSAKMFTTIMKLGSFMVGGPVATAIFNGLVGVAGAEMKKSIGGEAIDLDKDLKEVGIDFAGDMLTGHLSGEFSEAREAKEAEEALKAGRTLPAVAIREGREEAERKAAQKVIGTAAGKAITTEAQDKLVKGKSDDDTAIDVAKSGISSILPGVFGEKVKHAVGEGGKVRNAVQSGAGIATEKVTDKSLDAAAEKLSSKEPKKAEQERRKADNDEEVVRPEPTTSSDDPWR